MAYDEFLAERIQRVYEEKRMPYIAKRMFGGICFLVDDKMCAGVLKQDLMVRIDPQINEEQLSKPVGKATATNGWLDVSVDLSEYQGKSILLELLNKPSGWNFENGYWEKIAVESK